MLALGLIASLGGVANWSPQPLTPSSLALVAAMLLIPSLGEELLFRGLLFPAKSSPDMLAGTVASVLIFVLWHPLQYWSGLGPAWSEIFLRADFLACVAILGIGLSVMRVVAGSLWPPIIFHWLVVAAWKMLFDGPF